MSLLRQCYQDCAVVPGPMKMDEVSGILPNDFEVGGVDVKSVIITSSLFSVCFV